MIFDQNLEKLQIEPSAEEHREKAKSLTETSSTDSVGQEKKPLVTVPPTPPASPMRPVEILVGVRHHKLFN